MRLGAGRGCPALRHATSASAAASQADPGKAPHGRFARISANFVSYWPALNSSLASSLRRNERFVVAGAMTVPSRARVHGGDRRLARLAPRHHLRDHGIVERRDLRAGAHAGLDAQRLRLHLARAAGPGELVDGAGLRDEAPCSDPPRRSAPRWRGPSARGSTGRGASRRSRRAAGAPRDRDR